MVFSHHPDLTFAEFGTFASLVPTVWLQPVGAGLLFLPVYVWLWSGEPIFRAPYVVAPWAAFVAYLMVLFTIAGLWILAQPLTAMLMR